MIRTREILRLRRIGISISAISRNCNCIRNTVWELLRRVEANNLQWLLSDKLKGRLGISAHGLSRHFVEVGV